MLDGVILVGWIWEETPWREACVWGRPFWAESLQAWGPWGGSFLMEQGAGQWGEDGAEWTRSEVGVIREIMVAQAIKDLAHQGEDFGFCSETGSQRINKMFNRIPLPLKRVEKAWDGGEWCQQSSSVFLKDVAIFFIKILLAWILIWKKILYENTTCLASWVFRCPYVLYWRQGLTHLWPHSGEQKTHWAEWGDQSETIAPSGQEGAVVNRGWRRADVLDLFSRCTGCIMREKMRSQGWPLVF